MKKIVNQLEKFSLAPFILMYLISARFTSFKYMAPRLGKPSTTAPSIPFTATEKQRRTLASRHSAYRSLPTLEMPLSATGICLRKNIATSRHPLCFLFRRRVS